MSDFKCPCCFNWGYYCPTCNCTAPLPAHFHNKGAEMNDFKVGDEAWFFEFPEDGCGGFEVGAVVLKSHKITNERELTHGYLWDSYKSKQEAIDAFKRRLDEL